jgi:hypothetical protein
VARREVIKACVADVMSAAMGVMQRADVAELHRLKRS